jgi:hypothetical protein
MTFEVLMAVRMTMLFSLVVTLCRFVGGCKCTQQHNPEVQHRYLLCEFAVVEKFFDILLTS